MKGRADRVRQGVQKYFESCAVSASNTQIIISTHSEELLEMAPPWSLILGQVAGYSCCLNVHTHGAQTFPRKPNSEKQQVYDRVCRGCAVLAAQPL